MKHIQRYAIDRDGVFTVLGIPGWVGNLSSSVLTGAVAGRAVEGRDRRPTLDFNSLTVITAHVPGQ